MIGAVLKALTGDNARWFILAFVVAGVVTWAWLDGRDYGTTTTNQSWQTKWDEQVLQLAKAKADALEVARTEEHRRINAIEEIKIESKKQIEQARADAAAADATADRMHEQARRLAAASGQCTTDTTTAIRGAAARATNAIVLADVFQRADAAAGRLAAAYDQARAAGLACERSYDALHNARVVPR
jgi:xylose isomerase